MTVSRHTVAGTVVTMPVRIRRATQYTAMFSVDAVAAQRMIDYSGLEVCRYMPGRAIVVLMLMHYLDGDLGQYHEFGTNVMVNPPGSKASGPRALQSAGAFVHHLPVDQDDPAHLLRRKLVNAGFTRKRVMDKLPSIGRLCDTLIDGVIQRGECDYVRSIAAPLPMAVIGDMLGVLPEERDMLLTWSDELVCGLSSHLDEAAIQKVMQTFAAYTAFTMGMISKRRAEPTDDLFSILVNAEVEGQRMSDDEIVMETLLILIGGDETTRHTLSGGSEQLLCHRDQWERVVADPELLPGAIEEMLRWTSPVKNMCRTLTQDIEFHGAELKAGEKIMLMFESANFDETVFDDPDTFNIDRNPNGHLAFGFGTHFCMGNQLARLELKLMLSRVIERMPDLRLADEGRLPLRPANFVSGLEAMPVVFTPGQPLSL